MMMRAAVAFLAVPALLCLASTAAGLGIQRTNKPACASTMSRLCDTYKTPITKCTACMNANAAALLAVGCTPYDEQIYCKSASGPPSGPGVCTVKAGVPPSYKTACASAVSEIACELLNMTCSWVPSAPTPPPPGPPHDPCWDAMMSACQSSLSGDISECFMCLGQHEASLQAPPANCASTEFKTFCDTAPRPAPAPPPPVGMMCCSDWCQQPGANCWCAKWGCHECLAADPSSCNTPPLSGGCCTVYSGHNTAAPCINPYKCGECRDGHNCHEGQQCGC